DRRLTPLGHRAGLVDEQRMNHLREHEAAIARLVGELRSRRYQNATLEEWLRRPETDWEQIAALAPDVAEFDVPSASINQVVIETKYAGYIRRQAADIERNAKIEAVRIPATFDFAAV